MAATKIHYRLCQVCGHANSAEGCLVVQCEKCGKHLAPFYYFDESRAMGLRDPAEPPIRRSSALPLQEYPPLWGLTAYWEPDS